MSRCFPFPPPGYEKKPTTDEPDLLKKEKRKEKKHKKDKKEKDKKDGKEKKEKDRSEGKHKDKKDKKDKHRDKKKDKEKENGKSSAVDEKKVHKQFDGYNEEKLPHNDEQTKEKSSFSSEKKPFLQFQSGEYNEQFQKKEESRKEKNSSSDDKRSSILFHGKNGELVQNRIKAGETENSKFVQELDRRIRNEEKGTDSHQFFTEGRKNSFNKVEIHKTDGWQAIMDDKRFGRNAAIQDKINGTMPPLLDSKIDRRIEQKEKVQENESDKRGDKRKNKDRDKQRQGKDKDLEKEKREEKSKEKSEKKKAEKNKSKHIKKNDSMATIDNLLTPPPESSFQGTVNEGNLKKRKDMETNGVAHENETRPNKMARHIYNMSPENGRKLDSLQNPGSSLLDKQGASQGASQNSFKVGSKGQRVNGMITSSPVLVSAKKPPISSFNHVSSKASPIKSPPVITNHVAAQSSPIHTTLVHTTKPQPNHVAAQHLTPKPPPSSPNPIPPQPQPLPQTHPPSTIAKPPVSRPKPPPVVNKVAPPPSPSPSLPIPKKKPPAATEPSMKPPHPDTKYLNQILTVPKLDQWCGFDDQEWLFSGKTGPSSKKMTMEELQVQVWSEAKHIESVDVCALPYVIPY